MKLGWSKRGFYITKHAFVAVEVEKLSTLFFFFFFLIFDIFVNNKLFSDEKKKHLISLPDWKAQNY